MFELLINFLDAVGGIPGCSKAFDLRDSLREGQFRRASARAGVFGALGRVERARQAGADLVGTPAQPVATPAQTPAAPDDAGATRTLLRLRPGGRQVPVPVPAMPVAADLQPREELSVRGSGLNALIDAATELLTLAAQLRRTISQTDLRQLRLAIARRVTAFDAAARRAGIEGDHVITARYALCTLLDEAVLTTPWGADSPWGQHSLLSQFHNETWGGEKFFVILQRLLLNPARHLHLLEFMYVCLALGMQGKYRVAAGGTAHLQDVRARLYQAIRQVRGERSRELSERWRSAELGRARLVRRLPLTAVASITALALLAVYLGFSLRLSQLADPVYAALGRIGQRDEQASIVTVPAVARTLTLRDALADDIRAGRVEVIEQTRGSTIEIRGDGLFASGSADVDSALLPLLGRIAAALNRFDAPVRVTGHTDDQPIAIGRSLRFASNFELSQARAASVATVLGRQLDRPTRVTSEGRGDAQPVVANDSPSHRAQNRRVDITLLAPAATVTQSTIPATSVARKSS